MLTRRKFAETGLFGLAATIVGPRLLAMRADSVPAHVKPVPPLPASATLPDALIFSSGKPVVTRADWELRRQEILRTASEQMYGAAPPCSGIHVDVQEKEGVAFDGLARRRQLRLHLSDAINVPTINLLLYTPRRLDRAPVIAGLNFWGNHTLSNDPEVLLTSSWIESGNNPFVDLHCVAEHRATPACRGIDAHRWPVRRILERGYGVCTAYRGDIDADQADDHIPGLRAAYPEFQQRGDNFGAIGAWAWSLSRILDYLETDPCVDAKHVAVFGWSRLGKAAVWAGANDPRFAAVLSHESGAGGAKLFRHGVGEDIHRLTTVFPHWFCRNFSRYAGMDRELPFDQHLILSAIAPRPLFVASAVDDHLSDPSGEFFSTAQTNRVYRFLGSQGLSSEIMPQPGSPLIGHVSYQIRTGGHDVLDYDWELYLRFLDEVWR